MKHERKCQWAGVNENALVLNIMYHGLVAIVHMLLAMYSFRATLDVVAKLGCIS